MIRYAAEFIVGATPPGWARWFDHRYVPINLFDTMYVAFERVSASAAMQPFGDDLGPEGRAAAAIYNGRLLPEWQPVVLGRQAPFTIEVDVE